MFTLTKNAQRRFTHIHVRIKRGGEQHRFKFRRQRLRRGKQSSEFANGYFPMNNFTRMPRSQQSLGWIRTLLNHVGYQFDWWRIVGENGAFNKPTAQRLAPNPNENGDDNKGKKKFQFGCFHRQGKWGFLKSFFVGSIHAEYRDN